jgi:hypothetical protein
MKKSVVGMVACLVLLGLVAGTFAKDPAADAAPKKKRDPGAMFDKKDKDGDGKISMEEWVGKKKDAAADKLKAIFTKKDKDGDGFLTKADMAPKGGKKGGKKKKADQ